MSFVSISSQRISFIDYKEDSPEKYQMATYTDYIFQLQGRGISLRVANKGESIIKLETAVFKLDDDFSEIDIFKRVFNMRYFESQSRLLRIQSSLGFTSHEITRESMAQKENTHAELVLLLFFNPTPFRTLFASDVGILQGHFED